MSVEFTESGTGWVWDEVNRSSYFYFELEDAAVKPDGSKGPAGYKMALHQCETKISVKEREDFVAFIERGGVSGHKAKGISPKEYFERFDND